MGEKFVAEQFNLPFGAPRYPDAPGFKNKDLTGPSRQAAMDIAVKAPTLREQCMERLAVPMTADEIAEMLDKSILSIRPRVAELAAKGLIEDSGKRRANSSGKLATVWKRK